MTIASANNVDLDDVYAGGNTIDITATGAVTVSGTIDDAGGSVSIKAGGAITVAESTSAAGDVTLVSDQRGDYGSGSLRR